MKTLFFALITSGMLHTVINAEPPSSTIESTATSKNTNHEIKQLTHEIQANRKKALNALIVISETLTLPQTK